MADQLFDRAYLINDAVDQDLRNTIYSIGIYGSLISFSENTVLNMDGVTPVVVKPYTEVLSERHVDANFVSGTQLVAPGGAGDYQVWFQISFIGPNARVAIYEFYVNGVPTKIRCRAEGVANLTVNTNMLSIVTGLVEGDVVDVRASFDTAAAGSITINALQFVIKRIY